MENLYESDPLSFNDANVSQRLDNIEKKKIEKSIYKTFSQIHDEGLAAQKERKNEIKDLLKKYKIKLNTDVRKLPKGIQVVQKCNDDYNCYYSYKDKTFFVEEQHARDKSKKTIDLANAIIDFVNMKEQLYKIATLLDKYMTPKMLQKLFISCPFIKFDNMNPLYYMHYDEHYVNGKKIKNYALIAEKERKASMESCGEGSTSAPSPQLRSSSAAHQGYSTEGSNSLSPRRTPRSTLHKRSKTDTRLMKMDLHLIFSLIDDPEHLNTIKKWIIYMMIAQLRSVVAGVKLNERDKKRMEDFKKLKEGVESLDSQGHPLLRQRKLYYKQFQEQLNNKR